jgi:copper oxidase (laccase) domain-containing protein
MIESFNSNPKDIVVSLGPSIHSCCYEVGEDLAEIAKKSFGEKYIEKRANSFFLDLQTLNYDQLISAGILKENIDISQTCTCCDKNYFSYRRDGKTGRFAGVIKLNG